MSHLEQKSLKASPCVSLDSLEKANVFKAVADPLRLELLRVLRDDSFGVQELAEIFSMPQPGMSHHLKVLAQAGLVKTRRQGNSIFYRRPLIKVAPEEALKTTIYGSVDSITLHSDMTLRIENIRSERAKKSRVFFDKNAKKFAKNQAQICEVSEYIAHIRDVLDVSGLPRESKVMEVGPGQGAVLAALLDRFDDVVALDSSDEMLKLARTRFTSNSKQISFVEGSLESYVPTGKLFDGIVMNMVLHHMPSPGLVFKKLRSLLRVGGSLLIADLKSHDQDWVKEACGDLWLGFDSEEINNWAELNGFVENQNLFLGLKNGFQIQLKLFNKST